MGSGLLLSDCSPAWKGSTGLRRSASCLCHPATGILLGNWSDLRRSGAPYYNSIAAIPSSYRMETESQMDTARFSHRDLHDILCPHWTPCPRFHPVSPSPPRPVDDTVRFQNNCSEFKPVPLKSHQWLFRTSRTKWTFLSTGFGPSSLISCHHCLSHSALQTTCSSPKHRAASCHAHGVASI